MQGHIKKVKLFKITFAKGILNNIFFYTSDYKIIGHYQWCESSFRPTERYESIKHAVFIVQYKA